MQASKITRRDFSYRSLLQSSSKPWKSLKEKSEAHVLSATMQCILYLTVWGIDAVEGETFF